MSQRWPGGIINKTAPTPANSYNTTKANGVWTLDQAAYLTSQNLWPNPNSDQYFNYNTLLLNGDGTNGAQNNTFLDSSTNNFTITRNGNTTQGSFSPYGTLWSNYFGGSGNYMYPPTNASFNVGNGGTAFTFECWVYPVASGNFFGVGNGAAYGNAMACQWDGTNFKFVQGDGAYPPGSNYSLTSSSTYAANQWYHYAIVRNSSNVLTMYINGVAQASGTNTSGVASATQAILNGVYDNNGLGNAGGTYYVSNLRFVSGTAVYTSAFTPSTTPLTAISGTVLLTCQSNRFKDNSSNNYSFTVSGTPSVQRFSPFNPTAPYSTSVIGGSGYFDGSGDYLVTTTSSAFAFGTGNFTVECWFYANSYATDNYFFDNIVSSDGDASWAIQVYSGNLRFSGWTAVWLTSTAPTTNAWHHIAVSRSGTTLSMFVDGVRVATATNSTNFSSTFGARTGAWGTGGGTVNGYITDARAVKGTAVYDPTQSTCAVPTTPLTAITNTSLLENMTNAGIPDLAMMNNLETVGNAQVSTSVKKYGTGSLSFNGTTDWLQIPSSPVYSFGTGDFTIECWVNTATASGAQTLIDTRSSDSLIAYIVNIATGKLDFIYSSSRVTSATSVPTNQWVHLAVTRASGTIRLFINGVLDANTASYSSAINATSFPSIGGGRSSSGDSVTGYYLNGYIDDLRVTKGLARYTANFTPPTAALPTY